MSGDKKMTEQEIKDLVKEVMDEVMASVTPALEARQAEFMEKRAKEKTEAELKKDDDEV